MSGMIQDKKEDSDDSGIALAGIQESWDHNVLELTWEEDFLDDDFLHSALPLEPSLTEDMDIKGILSRKGKSGSIDKARQSASTIRSGKGKGADNQATIKDLEKIEKRGTVLASQGDKEIEEPGKQQQAETKVKREAEGKGDDDMGNQA